MTQEEIERKAAAIPVEGRPVAASRLSGLSFATFAPKASLRKLSFSVGAVIAVCACFPAMMRINKLANAVSHDLSDIAFDTGLPFFIGQDGRGVYRHPFVGDVDEFAIWTRTLTHEEVRRRILRTRLSVDLRPASIWT